jgi:hypothetical protein
MYENDLQRELGQGQSDAVRGGRAMRRESPSHGIVLGVSCEEEA